MFRISKIDYRSVKTIAIILILAIVASLIISTNITSSNQYEQVNLINYLSSGELERIKPVLSPPMSRDHFWQLHPGNDRTDDFEISFQQNLEFEGLTFYFNGDLSTQTSYGAKKISVYTISEDGNIKLVNRVLNNNFSDYEFFSNKKHITKKIRVEFSSPFYYQQDDIGEVRVNDLRMYRKINKNVFAGLQQRVNQKSQSIIFYWIFYFLFFILLVIPGFCSIFWFSRKYQKKFNSDFSLVFSPAIGVFLMFFSALLFLISGYKILLLAYPLFFLFSVIYFLKNKLYLKLSENKTLLLFFGLCLLLISLVIGQRDYSFNLQYIGRYLDGLSNIPTDGYPGYFVDNLFPWRIGRVYLHRYSLLDSATTNLLQSTTVYDRTPVLPLISTVVMNLFGEGHFVFQRFLEILSVLFMGAYYLFIEKIFSRKIAMISALLIILNVQMFLIASNAEIFYKFFSIYPVFLALLTFYFVKKYQNLLVGMLLALAFLIHPSTLIYSIMIIILYLFRDRFSKKLLLNVYPVLLPLFLVFIAWFLVPFFVQDATSSTNNHSFYLAEILKIDKNLFITKLINLVAMLFPNLPAIEGNIWKLFTSSYLLSYPFLRYSILANLTPIVFLLIPYFFVKNLKKDLTFIFIALSPLLIFWFFYLNQANFFSFYGGAYFILYPFVIPMCLAFIVSNVIKASKLLQCLTFISYIAFMFLNIYFISGIFGKINYPPIHNSFLIIILITYSLSAFLLFKLTFAGSASK